MYVSIYKLMLKNNPQFRRKKKRLLPIINARAQGGIFLCLSINYQLLKKGKFHSLYNRDENHLFYVGILGHDIQ